MRANTPYGNPAPEPGSTTGGHWKSTQHIPVMIGPKEAAAILAIGTRTLSTHTKTGAIPSRKLGALRRYVVRELHAWIDEGCPTEPGAGEAIRAKLEGGAS